MTTIHDYVSSGKNLAFFRCSCGKKLYVDDIYVDLQKKYEDNISEEADQNFNSRWDPGLKDIDQNTAEKVIKIKYRCNKCKKQHYVELLCEFEFYYEDEKMTAYIDHVIDYVIVDVTDLMIETDVGLLLGKDILTTIRWFILRWSITSEKTIIISPFIDEANMKFLEELYEKQLLQINKKGGLGKIITRQIQGRPGIGYFNLKTELIKSIAKQKEKCDERMKCSGDSPCFTGDLCRHQILEDMFHKTTFTPQNKFHAKLYAGCNKGESEVLLTSFNLLASELKQTESFALINMNSDELNNQILELSGTKKNLFSWFKKKTKN